MLTFDPERHAYFWEGIRVPNVTSILEPEQQFDGVSPAILEAARNFGTHVHLATHLHDIDELDEESLSPALRPYLAGWRKFLIDSQFKVVTSEQPLFHPRYRYAGTPDKVGILQGASAVIDVKSGAIPCTVGLQTAAYQAMISPKPRRRLCVQLNHLGTYSVHEQRDPSDLYFFLSALNLYQWRAKRARAEQHDGRLAYA